MSESTKLRQLIFFVKFNRCQQTNYLIPGKYPVYIRPLLPRFIIHGVSELATGKYFYAVLGASGTSQSNNLIKQGLNLLEPKPPDISASSCEGHRGENEYTSDSSGSAISSPFATKTAL